MRKAKQQECSIGAGGKITMSITDTNWISKTFDACALHGRKIGDPLSPQEKKDIAKALDINMKQLNERIAWLAINMGRAGSVV